MLPPYVATHILWNEWNEWGAEVFRGHRRGKAVKLLTAAGLQTEFDSLTTKMFLGRLSSTISGRGQNNLALSFDRLMRNRNKVRK